MAAPNVSLQNPFGAAVAARISTSAETLTVRSAEDAAKLVRSLKRQVRLLSFVGLTLIGIFMIRQPNVGVAELSGFLMGVVGNVVLLTVVGADFILGVLRSTHVQNKASEGTSLQSSLAEKLEALEELGDLPLLRKVPRVPAEPRAVP